MEKHRATLIISIIAVFINFNAKGQKVLTKKPVDIYITSGGESSNCHGKIVTLSVKGIPETELSNYSLQWYRNGTKIAGGISIPITESGHYKAVVKDNNTKKSKKSTIVINFLPSPTADVGNSSTICEGGSVIIGSAPINGSNYSWSPSNTLNSANSSNPIANPRSTQTYTLTETNTYGCKTSNTVTVTVDTNKRIPKANAGPSRSIAASQSVAIGAAAVNSHIYSWTSSPSDFTSTASNPTVSPSVTTTFTLTEIDTNGCKNHNSITITVVNQDSEKLYKYYYDSTFSEVQLTGGPDIVNAFTGSDTKSLPVSGNVGLYLHQNYQIPFAGLNRMEAYFNFNFASNADTIELGSPAKKSNFSDGDRLKVGTFMLRPTIALYSGQADFYGYLQNLKFIGFHIGGFAGNTGINYKTDSGKNGKDTVVNLGVGGIKAGSFIEFILRKQVENGISLKIGADLCWEGMFNDLAQSENAALRDRIFGTNALSYFGFQGYTSFRYKAINLSLCFVDYTSGNIPGFTNGQFLIDVSLKAYQNLWSKKQKINYSQKN